MELSRLRFRFVIGLMVLCFLFIEVRLFHLQVMRHPETFAKAKEIYHRDEAVLASRGRILMRNEFPLAESVPAISIWSDSRWTDGHRDEIASELQSTLGRTLENLRAELDKPGYRKVATEPIASGDGAEVRPISDGDVIVELWEKKRAGKLPGITFEKTCIRSYPQRELAANVVGYIDTEGRGQCGIERSFDEELTGQDGRRLLLRDVARRPIYDVDADMQEARDGADVHLTLDVVLQYYVEEALDAVMKAHAPSWTAALVMDPRTGEVLAMGSRPKFDPNSYSNYSLQSQLNRCASFNFTPGSAFKPFIMATVIEQTRLPLDRRFDCRDLVVDGRRIRDAHPHGQLTPCQIMEESSNIGMVRLALRLCPDTLKARDQQMDAFGRLRSVLAELGFGERTEIGLPAESKGKLASVRNWTRRFTLASIAFGHEISVTQLQLASAFCVFANDGIYNEPRLIDKVSSRDGTQVSRAERSSRRVFDHATVQKVRDMLIGVVDEGTGTKAQIDGYTVAGKTSTAQWENAKNKYTSSFIGFAPARDPHLLVSVVVDQPHKNGHYGGTVAAPAAREILSRGLAYLRVPQDRQP